MRARPAYMHLWTCPDCGRVFSHIHQSHSCGRWTEEAFLARASAGELELFQRFRALVMACGDVTPAPAQTRVGFQARMIFASVNRLAGGVLHAHVVLARRREHPRFLRIDSISPRNHVHHFRIASPAELDEEVRDWLAEAYQVGLQKHLRAPRVT